MVGIVLVSHSRALAEGAAELARQMGGAEVAIEPAGGLADGAIGTDAVRVAEAIGRAWSDDGVLVLMDLGSAVLSAEMALEFVLAERRGRVLLAPAPLVEGAVAAAVAARAGSPLADVAAEAAGGLAGKLAHLGAAAPAGPVDGPADAVPAATATGGGADGEVRARFVVDIPHGLHARPAALLVRAARGADVRIRNISTGSEPVSARSLNDIMVLGVLEGHELEVVATGPQARPTVDAIVALAARGFDDRGGAAKPAADARADGAAVPSGALVGLAASPGTVVAPVRRFHVPDLAIPATRATDAGEETRALDAAIAATRVDLDAQRTAVAAASGVAAAAIFDAHALLLEDDAILAPVRAAIADGAAAARAWHDAIDAAARRWEGLDDPYLRARAGDLRSVGMQTLAHLLGVPLPVPELDAPGILVADDLAPADAAGLDPATVLGVATAAGGPTSHAALLTRALGIPAVVGVGAGLGDLADGTVVALDGSAGFVLPDPSAEIRAAFEERAAADRATAERGRAAAPPPAAPPGAGGRKPARAARPPTASRSRWPRTSGRRTRSRPRSRPDAMASGCSGPSSSSSVAAISPARTNRRSPTAVPRSRSRDDRS